MSTVDLSVIPGATVQLIASPPFGGRSDASSLAELTDVDIETTVPGEQSPLVYDPTSQLWVAGARTAFVQVINHTTDTLDVGESEDFEIEAGGVFQILSIRSSSASWVRVYGTSSAREADIRTEPGEAPPASGNDFYAEIATVLPSQLIRFSPIPSVQSWYGRTFLRVKNTGASSDTITLSIKVLTLIPFAPGLEVSFLLQPFLAPDTDLDFNGTMYGASLGSIYGPSGYQNPYWAIQGLSGETGDQGGVDYVDNAYSPIIVEANPPSGRSNAARILHLAGIGAFDTSQDFVGQIDNFAPLNGVVSEFTFEYIFRYGDTDDNDYTNHGVRAILAFTDQLQDPVFSIIADRDVSSNSLRLSVLSDGGEQGTVIVPPSSYESFTHFAAVLFEDVVKFCIAGQSVGQLPVTSAPILSSVSGSARHIISVTELYDNNSTLIRTAAKGIRFTPKAIYFAPFSPPSSIDSLLPEYMDD